MTALQELIEWMREQCKVIPFNQEDCYDKAVALLTKEKQQIIDAAERWKGTDFAEKYYAETYGSKGSDDHIVDTNEMVSSQTEISDEDIEKAVNEYANVYQCPSEVKMCKHDIISAWKLAIEWYREQLKKQTQIGQG